MWKFYTFSLYLLATSLAKRYGEWIRLHITIDRLDLFANQTLNFSGESRSVCAEITENA